MNAESVRPGRVLVTGGASGLGAAVVDAVLKAGGTPVVLDRDISSVAAAKAFEVDVSDRHAVTDAVRQAAETLDGLDAVVTAAGIDRCGKLEDVAADEWEKVIGVNLLGTVSVVRAAMPYLKASRGRVVTIASTLGKRALPEASAYCASKFGVVGFTRALQLELAGRVGVTLLVPGGMRTHFFDRFPEQGIPLPDERNLQDPATVAETILFAVRLPPESSLQEVIVTPLTETSWP